MILNIIALSSIFAPTLESLINIYALLLFLKKKVYSGFQSRGRYGPRQSLSSTSTTTLNSFTYIIYRRGCSYDQEYDTTSHPLRGFIVGTLYIKVKNNLILEFAQIRCIKQNSQSFTERRNSCQTCQYSQEYCRLYGNRTLNQDTFY